MVLADDSPFERGLVQCELPDLAVVPLDGEPGLHVDRLLADGWFTVRELTAEDRVRPARYREDLARRDFLDASDTFEDYLAELEVRVRLEPVSDQQIPRVSQITLRTNQFNMTTRRLQSADVTALAADPAATVLAIGSSDRFGDNGLVGAILLRREGEILHIDNFLLSCRVFSRGIEQACLRAVLRHAASGGTAAVCGAYQATAKNAKVRDFYPRNGFALAGQGDGDVLEFRHDLAAIADPPAHVLLDNRLEGSFP
jgi:FkbH-like protein